MPEDVAQTAPKGGEMRLADFLELRSALGFDDMNDINLGLQSVLDTATIVLESEFDSPFDKGTFTDKFLSSDTIWIGRRPQIYFLLRRGFIESGFTMFHADSLDALTAGPRTQITQGIEADLERGLIAVFGLDLSGLYVSVDYTAGFDADTTEPDQFDMGQKRIWPRRNGAFN